MIKQQEYNKLPKDNTNKFIVLGIVSFLLAVALMSSIYTIQAGQRGVLLTFGQASETVSGEGLHFKIPLVQRVIKMDIKTLKYEADASSASKDLQVVSTKIAVNYRLLADQVPEVYRTIGINYQDRVIQPAVQEIVKAVTAKFTAEELVTKRAEVKDQIQELLKDRLNSRFIIVEEISITNFDFSESFNQAIEQKVTAEQLKLKAEKDLERIEIEGRQKVVSAEAEAQSIRIQSEALKSNPDILQLRAIEKWDGIMPKVTGGAMPFIQLDTD